MAYNALTKFFFWYPYARNEWKKYFKKQRLWKCGQLGPNPNLHSIETHKWQIWNAVYESSDSLGSNAVHYMTSGLWRVLYCFTRSLNQNLLMSFYSNKIPQYLDFTVANITHSEGTLVGCRWCQLAWCWPWWSPTALQPALPCLWLESPLSNVLLPLDPCLPGLFWWYLQNV